MKRLIVLGVALCALIGAGEPTTKPSELKIDAKEVGVLLAPLKVSLESEGGFTTVRPSFLVNGRRYTFAGKVVSLRATKGGTLVVVRVREGLFCTEADGSELDVAALCRVLMSDSDAERIRRTITDTVPEPRIEASGAAGECEAKRITGSNAILRMNFTNGAIE